MGRGVGIEPFEPSGDRQHFGDARIGLGRFAEARLVDDRLFQRDRIGGVLRHQLGEFVDLAERHFEHAPDIAHHAARQERAEGDDLRDAVGAIALADIGDHFVAPVLAEIDVEIGHRHAFGIEEALEQQAEADRIEIGDGQRIGDQRAGARTAPRPDRNILALGPLDEIGDDQEIAGEFHLDDDVELEGEPRFDNRSAVKPGAQPCAASRAASPCVGLRAQFADFVERLAGDRGKARQDGLARLRAKRAAHRDLDAVVGRLRQVREQLDHFGARLEAMLAGQPAPVAGADQRAVGDAEQRVLRFVIGGRGEIGFVGRDQRQRCGIGEIEQLRLVGLFGFEIVALHFDIEALVEQRGEPRQARAREIGEAGRTARGRSARPGPPVSAISPSTSPSASKRTCGSSASLRVEPDLRWRGASD